jgi:Putative adhesin
MKKQFIIIAILFLISSFAFAQTAGDFVVPLSDPNKRGRLKAHLNYGSITVKGSPRKDVLVRYKAIAEGEEDGHNDDNDENDNDDRRLKPLPRIDTRTSNNKSDGNKAGLKKISGGALDMEVTENDNVVRVSSNSFSEKMKLEIEVPLDFDLNVSTFNDGVMFISNVSGELELTNHNDDITAENISGSVLATSFNGAIKISFNKVKENTPMSFSTFNGDIDVTFPATLKATFKLKTEQGEILSGFDMNMVREAPIQKKETSGGTYKVVIDGSIKGEVNGGGPEFSMKNHNGDIIIRKK